MFESRSVDDLTAQLARVIINGEFRSRLAGRAERTAREDFPIEAAVQRLQNLYLGLLNGHKT